jgi:Ca2+-transporting ATPase
MGLLLLAGAFGLFEWAQSQDYSDAEARTVAVNTFMAVQIFYLFNCRSMRRSLFRINPFGNLAILGGVAVMIVLQLLFTYAGFMHVAFDSASIPTEAWPVIVGVGVAAMLLMEALGWVQRRARVV